ncbi:MAG: nickel-type superoxide dismutase maturation protease [bacterium]|nr:nickel-type superoxide dismutase maturation protease [bacterium]
MNHDAPSRPLSDAPGLKDLLLWLAGRRVRRRVNGNSMTPALEHGDEVLADLNAYRRREPREGDVVIALHPYQTGVTLIKRISRLTPDGRYHLASDNPAEGTDSAAFGPVDRKRILGRVSCRFGGKPRLTQLEENKPC